jgi:hypothetical protein
MSRCSFKKISTLRGVSGRRQLHLSPASGELHLYLITNDMQMPIHLQENKTAAGISPALFLKEQRSKVPKTLIRDRFKALPQSGGNV